MNMNEVIARINELAKKAKTEGLSPEETAERAALMAQVDTYAKEMMLKFIMGAESLDNFDKYLVEVTEYGLASATAITQAALDRYLGK